MKNRNIELFKNTIIIFLGKVSTQLLSFLLLPLYTAYLSTREYGMADLIITYIQLLVPVLTLEIEMAAFRFLIDNRNKTKEKEKIIYNVLMFITLVAIVFTIVFILLAKIINIKYVWLILLNVLVSMYGNALLQIARGLGDNIKYSLGSAINGGIILVLNIVLIVHYNMGAKGMLISMIFSNLIMSLYLVISLKLYSIKNSKRDSEMLKEMIKYSIPLVPNLISWWIVSVSDRTIISLLINLSANGIYSAANKFSMVFIGVYNVFNLSWTESAAIHYREKDRDEFFAKTINYIFELFASACVLSIAILPFIITYIIKDDYFEAYYHIPILLLASLNNVVIGLLSVVYVAEKNSKELAKTSLLAAIINVCSNLILIKIIGLFAASISTFIAYFSLMLFRLIDVKKYIKIKNTNKKFTITLIILLIPLLVSYYLQNHVFSLIMFVIVIVYCMYFNVNKIRTILYRKR